VKMIALLDPDMTAGRTKSRQHQRAAMTRVGMARLASRGGDADLRKLLLRQAWDFRELYGEKLPEAWAELSKRVDQFAAGEAVPLYRFECPDDHPARRRAAVDVLVLTEADELVSYGGFRCGDSQRFPSAVDPDDGLIDLRRPGRFFVAHSQARGP